MSLAYAQSSDADFIRLWKASPPMTLQTMEEFEDDFDDIEDIPADFAVEGELEGEGLEVEDPEYEALAAEFVTEIDEDDPPLDYEFLNRGKRKSRLTDVPSIERQSAGLKVEWIHPGILMEGMSTILVAREGVGKSLFAVNLANSVANGATFLGFTPKRKRPVMYLDLENPQGVVQRRIQEFGLVTGGNFTYVGSFTPGGVPNSRQSQRPQQSRSEN